MRRFRIRPVVSALVFAIALVVSLGADGTATARGWLCAFVLISMVPVGSLALLLAHGISGGRWGDDLSPVLLPAARTMPLLVLAFVPVILFRPLIYQWNDLALPHDVISLYLYPLFFDVRTLVALAIWSLLVWTRAWRNPLTAGLGLVVHLIVSTFVPADWILTIQPGSVSAGFGLGFGIEQMFAALAFAAVLSRQGREPRANRDLAGLLVTTLLGTMYFLYMQFIVTWYGNIPDKIHWYAARADHGWPLVAFCAFALGAAIPLLAALNPFVRRNPEALRIVGGLVLSGIALHVVWMVVPVLGAIVMAPAVLAALFLMFALTAASPLMSMRGGARDA